MYVKERAGYDVITDPYEGTFGQINIGPGGGGIGPGGGTTRNGGGIIIGDGGGGGSYVLDEGGGFLDPFYGFGANGSHLSGGNPFENSGLSASQLLTSLAPCGVMAFVSPSRAADCAWNAIRAILLDQPNVEEILTAVATMDCSTALTELGLPAEVVALACGFGGSFWTSIQAKAQAKLAELGFVPATPPAGERICPPHAEVVATDAAGNPTVLMVVTNTPVSADGTCPPGVPPVPGAAPPVAAPLPGETPSKQFVAMTRTMGLATFRRGTLTGRVVDAGGKPILGAQIRVGSLRNNPVGTTDASGAFSVPAPASSRNFLYVSAAGYVDGKVDGSATSGTTRDAGVIALAAAPVEKSGAESRWYTNKWLWIGVGAVAVAGIGGVVVMRRRRRG